MPNDEGNLNDEAEQAERRRSFCHSSFDINSSFVVRISSFIRAFKFFNTRASTQHHLLDVAGFDAGNCAGGFTVSGFAGANGFTNASSKS